jgi:hypothetical protein
MLGADHVTFLGIFIVGFLLNISVTVDLFCCLSWCGGSFSSGTCNGVEVQLSCLVFCWLTLGFAGVYVYGRNNCFV